MTVLCFLCCARSCWRSVHLMHCSAKLFLAVIYTAKTVIVWQNMFQAVLCSPVKCFCQIKPAVFYILQDCIFLEDKLCSIYKVRPTQCATYPWWPDLMNPVSWQVEAAEVCEGLDHEDAESLDVQQASEKLMTAAEYFVMKDAAPRRTRT